MTGAPDSSGSQRHSPEDTKGVTSPSGSLLGAESTASCSPSIGGSWGLSLGKVLLPPPQRARGESEDGGVCSREHEGSRQVATAQTDFSLPWPGLAFSLPRPQPSDSARETGKATPSQPLVLALLASHLVSETTRLASLLPEGSDLLHRSSAVT